MKAFALLVVCGCDQLFGLDTVPSVAADAPVDTTPRTVSCDYLWHVVAPDPNGVPGVTILAATPGYAHISVGGHELAIGGDGSFSFTAERGTPYELEAVLPTGTYYFDRDSDTCHLVTPFFQRQSGARPTASTPVTIDTPAAPPAGSTVYIASTGIRTFSGPTALTTSSWKVDWESVRSLDAQPADLLDAADGDRLFWEAFANAPGYSSLVQAAEMNATLVDGQPTTFSVAPVAVPQRCIAIASHEGGLAAIAQANSLRSITMTQTSWAIVSSPAPSEGVAEHQPLAITGTGDVADHTARVSYGNPFAGETDLFQIGIAVEHSLSAPGASAIKNYTTIVARDLAQADPTTACNASVGIAVPGVAMVVAPAVAGQRLAADDQPVTIDRGAPVPVHVELSDGPQDVLTVVLDEVSASGGTTAVTTIATYYPLEHDLAIDPAQLLVGHTYMLELQALVGQPLARAEFDFRTYAFPLVQSINPSTTFRIAN